MNEIDILLKSIEKSRKAKKNYCKPQAVKELELLKFEHDYKNSNIPEYVKSKDKYRDDTANGLTKCIIAYLRLSGAFCTRLNSTGIYRADIKRFVRNTQRKGLADVVGIHKGLMFQIEVKIGKDKMSKYQKQIKKDFKKAGGYYFIAKDFESFKDWFDNIFCKFDTNK